MNEFIQMAVSQLGVSESAAKSATGGMLGFLKDQVGGADFGQLMDKLPGASELIDAAPAAAADGAAGGGLLGGLMGKATGMLGGGGSDALAGLVTGSGMGIDKLGSFATMFVDFAKDKAGADLVGRIMDGVPDLKKMLG